MDSKKTINLSVIIPTYNEVDRIGDTLKQIHQYFRGKQDTYEVIVVDADSPDGTAKEAIKSSKYIKHLEVISAGPKPSKRAIKGKQVKLGMLKATGAYIMFMDADLATPLKYLSDVSSLAKADRPVGICVRDLQKSHTGIRKLVSSFANFLVQLLILPGIKDTQCGFKAFRSDVAKQVFSRQTIVGWGFDMEVLAIARQLGYQIDTINVPDWKDVQHGESDKTKLSGSKFSALKAAVQTFPDLFKIKWGLISGRYKKPIT